MQAIALLVTKIRLEGFSARHLSKDCVASLSAGTTHKAIKALEQESTVNLLLFHPFCDGSSASCGPGMDV